jgi:hypothetical protein
VEINKFFAHIIKNYEDYIVICGWSNLYGQFPGIWVLAQRGHRFSSYNIYVCKRGLFGINVKTIIPIIGDMSDDKIKSLAKGNEVVYFTK